MSGSFERLSYDPRAYMVELRQSTAPNNWTMDPIRNNQCNPCRPSAIGYIGSHGVSINKGVPLINVESELQRMNYKNTHDPMAKYIPYCQTCCTHHQIGYPCGGGKVVGSKDCRGEDMRHYKPCSLRTNYTREELPICTARGVGWNRFQPICLDPQDACRWEHPSEYGINYRMVVKDNHMPHIPVPIDQTAGMPQEREGHENGVPAWPKIETYGVFDLPMHANHYY